MTSYGIPHITANDFGSLGYGEGYMAAKDQVCNIAYAIVEARGERAKYYGAGVKNNHLMSDIVVRALGIPSHAGQDFAAQPLQNRQWITGYSAGYNRYIHDTGRDKITSWCKGASWVRPISPADIFARFRFLAQTTPHVAGMIVAAEPPKMTAKSGQKQSSAPEFAPPTYAEITRGLGLKQMGSNGWAFGSERTKNGHGMLLGNPHYPWTGPNRFWEKQLTIPGKINIYGVHLIGVPGVAIGFNDNVGWTHTVSNSQRLTFYRLTLVPGDPTSYYYDGAIRHMTAKKITIPVRQPSGKVVMKTHIVWFSHYGPMVVLPTVPWTKTRALTVRDANFNNQDLFSQWKAMDMARSMDAFEAAHRKWNALPWVNTIATSKDGRAVYIDDSSVGLLSKQAIALWRQRIKTDPMTKAFHNKGLILLDGSDSRFEWQSDPRARAGSDVVPFAEQPRQERRDYVFNSNDSYWLTNASAPLRGYSPLYGPVDTARTLRTRINALLLSDLSPTGPAGADGKFTLREMQQAILSNRSLSAELLLNDLVAACTAKDSVMVAGKKVDLTKACAALGGYNKHLDLDSRGAVLFREWITQYNYSETRKKGKLFSVAFDPKDPVHTPRGLGDKNLARQNLGKAVLVMKRAGLALDSRLADAQFAYRGDKKIALHGGNRFEGIANIIDQRVYYSLARQIKGNKIKGSRYLTDKGYPITGGTSFLLSLSYTDNGPKAAAFLTYSESGDPTSPHYSDQTTLFAKKHWRPIRFTPKEINQDLKASFILPGPRQPLSGQGK
ncbi:MAG: acylase [Alphaproteobacteria bacterium]|nr:acylase [Alphaproteobacteria bacterium]